MSIQEPAWLKRTRPCPFFSQGRCLFADSCNFLHDVKVKNAVTQPLRSSVQLPSHPPKPVFNLPAVVVDSASPRSDHLASLQSPASPVYDSSRYSGLLSVLSDVIGPPSDPPNTSEDAVPASRATPVIPSSVPRISHGRANLCPESNSIQSSNTVAGMKTEQDVSSGGEPSIHEIDLQATLVGSFGHRMEPLFPKVDDEPVSESQSISDIEGSGDEDGASYCVEATEAYVIGSEAEEEQEEEDVDNGEEDPTVILSNRQSTLSSFTGASLLASPRHSIFGELSVATLVENGTLDLLSPVQMSAKLRPFSVPSLGSKVKRGDSIDSGYADGDSWTSPVPFPRSPPRSFRSSVTFLSHFRRVSLSSPALRERRVSYDIGARSRSPHSPIEAIKEVELDGSLEDDEDAAYTILGAYDASLSEERPYELLQVHVAEGKAEEDSKPSEVPAVRCGSRRYSPERLHPIRECDLDSCNQPSFISDDNLSFKTALSTQSSYEDLSDISRVSPVRQDSLLSSISGCSTPNTSVFSHYGDANEILGQSNVGSHACESSCLNSSTAAPDAGTSECSLSEDIAKHLDMLFVSGSTDDLQGLALEKVVTPRGSLLASNPSVDTSHGPSLAKNDLGRVPLGASELGKTAPDKVVSSQNCLSGVFHFDKQPPKSSPPTGLSHTPLVSDAFSPAPLGTNDRQRFVPESSTAPQEHLPGILHYDQRSPKSSPSTDSHSPSSCDNALGHTPTGPSDFISQNRLSHVDERAPKSDSFAESLRNLSSVRDVLEYAPPDANGNDSKLPGSVRSVLHDCFPEDAAAEADQRPVAENTLRSNDVTAVFDSEYNTSPRRLLFPLPPPFLPAEIVGHSTLEDMPVLSEATVMNLQGDVSSACAMSQDEEMEWMYSGSELTEKARPSQLPSVRSPDFNTDFTLRRSRAASDLTVKANSPPVTPGDLPAILSLPLEQPDRSDSVQSLYDQYFDDAAADDGSDPSISAQKDTSPPDVPTELSQEDDLQSLDHVFQRASSSGSNGEPGNSRTDSPQSETVLRPLLTGRKSFLRSSLAELIPNADLANDGESSVPIRRPTRLQAREIGSTMVPLGFRRHKPQPVVTQSSQPLHTMLRASQLREVLRIRTDIAQEDSSPGCSSATHVPFTTRSPLPVKAMSAPPTGGLRQLRLSSILSTQSSSIVSNILSLDQLFNSPTPQSLTPQSPSVSPTTSFSRNSSLSPSYPQIPEHIHHTLKRSTSNSLILQANDDVHFAPQSLTRRESRSTPIQQPMSWRLSHYRAGSRNYSSADGTRRISRRTSTLSLPFAVDEEQEINKDDSTMSLPIQSKYADDWSRPASVLAGPVHAIATPKPNLLFAIASDDVDQVRQVLESGEAGPNDCVGPQSALAFTLTNDRLTHKQEIVKALLAYGANPSALQNPTLNPAPRKEEGDELNGPPPETMLEGMDPATRYFVTRADAAHTRQTSQLISRSLFRPLTRVRYDVIGQDWALEQLFRVLSMHSQKLAVAPIVVLLCGPSGHGKSLLARKFGLLLDVPAHTVNMTTLRSAHDIWQSYSMSPYEEPSSCTLAEFLMENEGKRCVVVLDEIEKVEDQRALWSLLMPWELGRCSLEAGKRHVDARNVIWLGTSNVGHELVFEHHKNRAQPDQRMSREDYHELTALLRPRVSHCLGASLVSRVTTVLPFVPFTLDEKKAIAAEAVYALAGDASRTLSPQDVESLVTRALPSYHPNEGARSLHRAISSLLVDAT